jgi:hypothetical protein
MKEVGLGEDAGAIWFVIVGEKSFWRDVIFI